MGNILEKVIGDFGEKKEWRAIEKRAKALPKEYRIAYLEIRKYIWNSTGISTIKPFGWLIDLFEESVADGKKVLDVIGTDVADFADNLVKDEQSYFENWRKKLNKDVAEKLKKKS